jgi:LmbE family N-acetylglucosaminyl deacetylase
MNVYEISLNSIKSLRYYKDLIEKKFGVLVRYSDENGKMEGRFLPNKDSRKNIDVMVIAAHPDDETIGIGGIIQRHVNEGKSLAVIFVTTGGRGPPNSLRIQDRILLRKSEAISALCTAGVLEENIIFLGFPDRITSMYMDTISEDIKELLKKYTPSILYTHSVEGGNFDHDIVGLVSQLVALEGKVEKVIEWAEYNETFPLSCPFINFPDYASEPYEEFILDSQILKIKLKMLECYKSQNLPTGSARIKEAIRPVQINRTVINSYEYVCSIKSFIKVPRKRIKRFIEVFNMMNMESA